MKFSTFLMIAVSIAIGWGLGWYTGKGGSLPNPMTFFPQPAAPPAASGTPTATTANLAPPPPSQTPGTSGTTVLTAEQILSCKQRCLNAGPAVCYRGSARINACQAKCEGATDADLLDRTCNLPQ